MRASRHDKRLSAFARIDLLAIIAVLLLLGILQQSALSSQSRASRSLGCMANLKLLSAAWLMYAVDHSGDLVNPIHHFSPAARTWASGSLDWTSRSDNTNVLLVTEQKNAALAPYLNCSPRPFLCPTDDFLSDLQRSLGWTSRTRSYALNMWMGDFSMKSGRGSPFVFRKLDQLVIMPPNEAFLFMDTDPGERTMTSFIVFYNSDDFTKPGVYHDQATGISFADGHVEKRKWAGLIESASWFSSYDVDWLKAHATRIQ